MPSLLQHRGGAGEPMVLLHGLGASWRTWLPVLGRLEARHDVLAVDLPGFGSAPPLDGGRRPTVSALVDAVEAELDDAGVAEVHAVGDSLGGRLAVELARRGRALSLVAIAPSGFEAPPERAWVLWADEAMRLRSRVAARFGERLTASVVARSALLAGIHARPWRVPPDEAAHVLEVFGRSPGFQSTLVWAGMLDWPRGLASITCPARIAFGDADALLGAMTAPRYALAIPGADLRWLRGCGHAPMIDSPGQVARAILEVTAPGR